MAENESMVDLAHRVLERQEGLKNLEIHAANPIERLVLAMHEDMAEFMKLTIRWMQLREEAERRHAYGG